MTFSDAMSSICVRWRRTSFASASLTAGSVSAGEPAVWLTEVSCVCFMAFVRIYGGTRGKNGASSGTYPMSRSLSVRPGISSSDALPRCRQDRAAARRAGIGYSNLEANQFTGRAVVAQLHVSFVHAHEELVCHVVVEVRDHAILGGGER